MNVLNLRFSVFETHFKAIFDWHTFKFIIWPVMHRLVENVIEDIISEKGIDCDYEISIIEELAGMTWSEIKDLI